MMISRSIRFPTLWKKSFPMNGKVFRGFSNEWKKVFHTVENFMAAGLLFCGIAAVTASGAPTVSFDIQPRLLTLGEAAQASVTFHGIRSAPQPQFPVVENVQFGNPALYQSTINGQHSVTYSYQVVPRKSGSFTMAPNTLDLNGTPVRFTPVTLEVRPPQESVAGADDVDLLFARVRLPEKPPYVHQSFELLIQLYVAPGIQLGGGIDLAGGFPESGLALSGFETLQVTREEINGHVYDRHQFRARARALTSGRFSIQPALRVGVVDPNQQQQRRRGGFDAFFDDPFFNRRAIINHTISTPPVELDIRPIPREGQPADYSGAVGNFQLGVDVRPQELKVGEPITVSIRLQGRGNIGAARPPVFAEAPAYRVYEARQVGDSPSPTDEAGGKVFEQVVIPRTDALTELPALTFTYFDPDIAQYRTISRGPFPLVVHPSENGNQALMLQVPGGHETNGGNLILGSDIVYLKPAPRQWKTGAQRWMAVALVVSHVLLLGGVIGVYTGTRRKRRMSADVAFARRHKAPRAARAALRRAEAVLEQSPTPGQVFTPLTQAVLDYFGHRLNLPPGAVDGALILDKLQKAGVDETALAEWKAFFELSEQIHYAAAPELTADDLTQWVETTARLLRQAERSQL